MVPFAELAGDYMEHGCISRQVFHTDPTKSNPCRQRRTGAPWCLGHATWFIMSHSHYITWYHLRGGTRTLCEWKRLLLQMGQFCASCSGRPFFLIWEAKRTHWVLYLRQLCWSCGVPRWQVPPWFPDLGSHGSLLALAAVAWAKSPGSHLWDVCAPNLGRAHTSPLPKQCSWQVLYHAPGQRHLCLNLNIHKREREKISLLLMMAAWSTSHHLLLFSR